MTCEAASCSSASRPFSCTPSSASLARSSCASPSKLQLCPSLHIDNGMLPRVAAKIQVSDRLSLTKHRARASLVSAALRSEPGACSHLPQ